MVQFRLKLWLKSCKSVIFARFLLYSYARRRKNDLSIKRCDFHCYIVKFFVTWWILWHQTPNPKEPLLDFASLERSWPHLRFLDLLNSNKQLFWELQWQQMEPNCPFYMEPHTISYLSRPTKFSWHTVTRNIYFAYQIIRNIRRYFPFTSHSINSKSETCSKRLLSSGIAPSRGIGNSSGVGMVNNQLKRVLVNNQLKLYW